VRAKKTIDVQKIMQTWVTSVKLPTQVRLQIDIDPYSFL